MPPAGSGARRGGASTKIGRAPLLLAAAAALAGGCGGGSKSGLGQPLPPLPARAATAGDSLLAMLPAGAEVVIELDLERARGNPVIGGVVGKLLEREAGEGQGGAEADPLASLGAAPLAHARAVVVASYHVGSAEAGSLTLLRCDGPAAPRAAALRATAIGDDVLALGPPELVEQAQLVAAAAIPANSSQLHSLLALRAKPMPEGATGAVLRVTAELSFEARVSLARQTSLEAPPARLALWADVADDAALVVMADSRDEERADGARRPAARPATTKAPKGERGEPSPQQRAAERLAAALTGALGELARDPRVTALGLGQPLRNAKLSRAGSWIQLVVLVGPERLGRAVERAAAWLALPSAATSPSPQSPAPEESP